jgi:hypothetical protein
VEDKKITIHLTEKQQKPSDPVAWRLLLFLCKVAVVYPILVKPLRGEASRRMAINTNIVKATSDEPP